MKPLHVAKGEKHVIIFPPNDMNNIYLMILSEFKQITFLLITLADRANCNFHFFSHWFWEPLIECLMLVFGCKTILQIRGELRIWCFTYFWRKCSGLHANRYFTAEPNSLHPKLLCQNCPALSYIIIIIFFICWGFSDPCT